MKNPEDNLITIVTNKEITRLYKTLLEMVEDLKKDHEIMLDKIKEKTNEDFTNSINLPSERISSKNSIFGLDITADGVDSVFFSKPISFWLSPANRLFSSTNLSSTATSNELSINFCLTLS